MIINLVKQIHNNHLILSECYQTKALNDVKGKFYFFSLSFILLSNLDSRPYLRERIAIESEKHYGV